MHITCNWQRKLKMTPTFYFGPVDSHTPMKTGTQKEQKEDATGETGTWKHSWHLYRK